MPLHHYEELDVASIIKARIQIFLDDVPVVKAVRPQS
jgi:hypothetical protein